MEIKFYIIKLIFIYKSEGRKLDNFYKDLDYSKKV